MKYLFLNNIKYMKKNIKLLIVIMLLEIVFQNLIMGDNIINEILGRCPSDIYNFIAVLFYILNVCFYVYVILYIYSNDLTYNLENIFLRTSPSKFIFSKIIFAVFCIFLFRTAEYLIILPLIIKEKYKLTVIVIIIKDVLYYCFISLFAILLRNLSYCIDYLYVIIIILTIVLVPKNIDIYYIYYFIGILILSVLNLIVVNKKCKYIFEKESKK